MEKHDNAEVNQYAQRIISTPGKHDGLVAAESRRNLWMAPSPTRLPRRYSKATRIKSQPYRGYYFKILKGQGPSAPLGKMDFMFKGAMIGGFALAAAPADYRVTGVKSFIVSYEKIVYQRDLGPNTLEIFKKMELYDPEKTWHRTDDNW